MMMKIFGAVLIVSGGALLGRELSSNLTERCKGIGELVDLFEEFDHHLKEYRLSFEEYLSSCKRILPKELERNDRQRLEAHLKLLRESSYDVSLEANARYLQELSEMFDQLKQKSASSGKALPLVAGAMGLLLSVMMF